MHLDKFNVMIDLETLSTEHNAVVLSLGATMFRQGKDSVKNNEFYARIVDPSVQHEKGCHVSLPTVAWWIRQDPATAMQAFPLSAAELGVMSTMEMLTQFRQYLTSISPGDLGQIGVWANGSDFDCVILASLYRAFKMPAPWEFRQNRCYRTIKNMYKDVQFNGQNRAKHNAL